MTNTYGARIRSLRDEYRQEEDIKGDVDFVACAEWLVDTERYQLPPRSAVQECIRDLKKHSKDKVDEAGNRYWIHGHINDKELWNDRREASWELRQSHLNVLADNRDAAEISARKMCSTLNGERKKGEPEFQLRLFDDNDDLAVA